MADELRWHYRFRNFPRSLLTGRAAFERGIDKLNDSERKEGTIKGFEYTFELSRNALKDR